VSKGQSQQQAGHGHGSAEGVYLPARDECPLYLHPEDVSEAVRGTCLHRSTHASRKGRPCPGLRE